MVVAMSDELSSYPLIEESLLIQLDSLRNLSVDNLKEILNKLDVNSSELLKTWLHNTERVRNETPTYEVPTNGVILLSILYGSISLIAVLGNALVMWIVATSRNMHSVTNYFIANLALADIIIGLFAIPFQFQAALLQRWVLPHFMCAFCPFFQTVSVNASIFTLTAIAVDRYRAIVNPFNIRPSKFKSKIIIGSVWLISIILAIPNAVAPAVIFTVDEANGGLKPFCAEKNLTPRFMSPYKHLLVGVQYFAPLAIISFAYIRIGWELWGSEIPGIAMDERDAYVLKNKKKVIKMLFVVVALFAFCWAPLQTYYVLEAIYPTVNDYEYINYIWFCSHWLAMSNSCCNPFIYAIYNDKFKREFRYKFRCLFQTASERNEMERSRYQASFRFPMNVQPSSPMITSDETRLGGQFRVNGEVQPISWSTRVTGVSGVSASENRLLSSSSLSRPGLNSGDKSLQDLPEESSICVPLKSCNSQQLHQQYPNTGPVDSSV